MLLIRTFLILLILCGILNTSYPNPTKQEFSEYLTTKNYIDENIIKDEDDYLSEYSSLMQSYMNLSVQPCDDFYEYACGNWKNTIKEKHSIKHRFNVWEINFKMDDIVDEILQKSNINDVAPEYASEFDLAKKFYNNCLETKLHPMQKSSKFLEIIQNIGGFPALEPKWNASQFSWLNMSAHMTNYGVESFIKEDIYPAYPFLPYFLLPTYGFDIELHYDNIANVSCNAYQLNYKQMHKILSLYGVDQGKIDEIVTGIFTLLTAILKLSDQFEGSQINCEKYSESLDSSVEDVFIEQFSAYFDIAWMRKFDDVPKEHMPCIYFYNELNKICGTHKESVANYLSLKFLYHMDAGLKDAKFGKDYCKREIRNSFSFFFDSLYMKIFFNKEVADDVVALSKEIRRSLRSLLEEADWLDESTREAALLKESLLRINVGRYEDAATQELLRGALQNLKFVENSYDANRANLKKFQMYIKRYYGLHQELIGNDTKPLDFMRAMVVNGFYFNLDNTMYIAAGLLQPPVYHKKWPLSLKYGTLGFILGHEVGHGFDTTGANFDHNGEINRWWSDKADKIFQERAHCFVEHYNNYMVPEINKTINGEVTNDENLADHTALITAYMAYKHIEKATRKSFDPLSVLKKENQMPGLNLSMDQLFFLGAAQLWCSDYNEAQYWKQLTDDHTIDKYRVLGMVSNNADFAKAFNCPAENNIIQNKCRMW